MNEPKIIDQNLFPSNVLIYLIQHPMQRKNAPILNVEAVDITVNIFMLTKNIGTEVIPKQSVHKFTSRRVTSYAAAIKMATGVRVILTAAPSEAPRT
jgi:hypothetical protein